MGLPIPLQSFSLFLGNSCSGRRSFCSSISCWCSVFRPMTFTNVLLMFFSIGCRILTLVRRWFMIQHDTSTKLTTHIGQNFLYTFEQYISHLWRRFPVCHNLVRIRTLRRPVDCCYWFPFETQDDNRQVVAEWMEMSWELEIGKVKLNIFWWKSISSNSPFMKRRKNKSTN